MRFPGGRKEMGVGILRFKFKAAIINWYETLPDVSGVTRKYEAAPGGAKVS